MEGLIFDCDGTLADTMPAHYVSWLETLAPYGIRFPEDRFWALGGYTAEAIVELLAREQGIAVDAAQVAREKDASYGRFLDQVKPVEPVLAVARRYRGRIPMAVATGGTREFCHAILSRLGIVSWFEAVVCAEDVTHCKPHPEVFLLAAQRIGIEPAGCRVYEDTDPGIEAARRAGMEAIDVRSLLAPE